MMVFNIFILEQVISSSILYKQAFTSSSFEIENWQLLGTTVGDYDSACDSTQILGGYQILGKNSVIKHFFTLSPHSQIRIKFDFWKIDKWGTDEVLIIFIDDQIFYWSVPNYQASRNLCGNNAIEDFSIQIDQTIDHNFNSALLILFTTLTTDDVILLFIQGFWGISNLNIFIEECPQGCIICNVGELAFQCIIWTLGFQELTETTLANFEIDGWKINNNPGYSQLCSDIPLLCGYNQCGNNAVISKFFNLPGHSLLKIHLSFFKIDSWDTGEVAILEVDNSQMRPNKDYLFSGYDICGQTSPYNREKSVNIELKIQHFHKNLEFEVTSNLDYNANDESFGIRDFQIFLNNRCYNVYYYECCGDSIKQMGEECDDGNMIPFDGCHNCQFSCAEGCLQCINGYCINCQDGWILQRIYNQCQLIAKYSTIIYYQDNHIWRQDNLSTQISFFEKCEIVFQEVCIQCNQGWKQCEITQNSYQDLIYDNVFIILNQASKYIQILCDQFCNVCVLNKCLQCKKNYYINKITNTCESLCGDSVQSYNEQCDDGNNYMNDGCYQCQVVQFNKCNDKCSFCYYGICEKCDYGFKLYNNECYSICGDTLVNKELHLGQQVEECDNPQSEGCVDCKIKTGYLCVSQDTSICWTCQIQCTLCVSENNNLQCKECIKGYYLEHNQCLKCDNQCTACISKSYVCTEEVNEDEILCDNNIGLYYFDELSNCISKCGDGIVFNLTEQCDDGNSENGDGCSSACAYEFRDQQPTFRAEINSVYLSTQVIILSFSQQVKRGQGSGEYINKIAATIFNLSYNLSIIPIQIADNNLNQVSYILEVVIFQNLNYKPKLQIELLETLYNELNLPLDKQVQTITLQKTFFLSEAQKQITSKLAAGQTIVVYSLSAVVGLLFLSGSRVAAWAALELLQEQSYLRYINIIYPQNMEMYFNSSFIISFQPILNFFDFQIIQDICSFQFIQAGDKFQLYNINANLAYNIQSLTLNLIIFFLIQLILKQFLIALMSLKCFENSFFLAKILRKMKLYVKKLERELQKNGQDQLLLANTWDITFISFLQISYVKTNDYQTLNILAIILLGIIAYTTIQNFQGIQKNQNLKIFWNEKLDYLILLKKLIFMAVLVFCQRNQNLQIYILCIINSSYFIMSIKLKIFQNRKEKLKQCFTESSTIIFLLTTQLYCNDTFIMLTSEQKILLGWFNICLLMTNVTCHLLLDSLEALQIIISQFRSEQNKNLMMQNNQGNQNNSKPVQRQLL